MWIFYPGIYVLNYFISCEYDLSIQIKFQVISSRIYLLSENFNYAVK